MFVFCLSPLHFSLSSSVSGHRELPRAHCGRVPRHAHVPADGCSGPSVLSLLKIGLQVPVSAALGSPVEVGWRSETCALVTVPMPFQPAQEHLPVYALSPSV